VSGKSLAKTSERDGSKKVDDELKIAFVSKPLFCELKLVASLNGEKALKVDEGADEVEATNAANRRTGRPLCPSWMRTGIILPTLIIGQLLL